MAFAAAVHPAPISPPPAGRAPSRLAAAAVAAVICLFLASMWLFLWALGAWHVGLLFCGTGCPVVVAAGKVLVAAGFAFMLLLCFGVAPLMACRVRAAGAAPIDVEAVAVQAPAPNSFAAAMRKVLRDPGVIAMFASVAFLLLLAVGVLLNGDSPVKGSRRERMGSVIYVVGALGMNTVNCLVLCPIMTVTTWRIFRMA